jgi:replicative DNA helicase
MLAHLIGDGCMAPRQPLHYTSADPANLDAVDVAASHFGVTARRVKQGNWWHSYLSAPMQLARGRRNPIVAWLDALGLYGLRSHEKFIPAAVFAAPDDQVGLFLQHLWATDGSVGVYRSGPGRIYYASTSRRLVGDVQDLLLRFEIPSRIKRVQAGDHRPAFVLDVYGVAAQLRFLELVGIHGARSPKAEALRRHIAGRKPNPNLDTIPIDVWRHVKQAMAGYGVTERAMQAAVGSPYNGSTFYRHSPSRPRLARVAAILDAPDLNDLATSDVFWDEVSAIVPLGEQPVFDATVPGTHNFIADGVVAHNSIEQDADVVVFLYRDGEQNPDAEVELVKAKVAKHRNGPIGEVPLQFRKANTRFYTVAAREEIAAY